jgi:basic amino acid/polyamine antiporter, APA family
MDARRGSVAGERPEAWSDAWRRWNTPKPVSAYEAEAKRSGLHRTLGPLGLTALGVSGIIGAGIFVLPGVGVQIAGPGLVLGFALAGFTCVFAAMAYSELATMMPIAGSAYAYTYVSLGELLAWLVGWNLVLEYALSTVAVAVGWSGFFGASLRGLGVQLPAAITRAPGLVDPTCGTAQAIADACVPGVFNIPAFLIILLIMSILVKGVKESAGTAVFLVGVKLFVLLFVIFFGAFYVDPANFNPFLPFGSFSVVSAGAIVFFAYVGFDAVSTAAEETKNPGRDLPIGIIGSLLISTVLYIAVTVVLTGITPWQNFAGAPDAASAAFNARGLGSAGLLIAVGAIVGITGVLLTNQLGMPRILMGMARDGLLPRSLARVHPTYRTPAFVTVLGSVVMALLAGFTPLAAAVNLVNIGTLFAFVAASIAVVVLRKRMPDAKRPFRVPFAPWSLYLGIGLMILLSVGLGSITLIRFVGWTGIGLMIYGFYGGPRSNQAKERRGRRIVLEEA